MTKLDKRNAVAEIDGFTKIHNIPDYGWHGTDGEGFGGIRVPNYPEDYNAIIRVIQKQPYSIRDLINDILNTENGTRLGWTEATEEQLCDALLAAHGKLK